MTTRKIIFIILIFLFFLTAFRLLWLHYFSPPEQPYASQGTLDLRQWDPISDFSLTLDGEWEYFPNKLLMKADRKAADTANDNHFIKVPSNWEDFSEDSGVYGFGSYRLHILIDPAKGTTYGIQIPNIRSSSEMYINGELISQSGKPAEDKQNYEPSLVPSTAYFTLEDTNEIKLVIHVTNYHHPSDGGIVQSLKFGLAEPFLKETNFATNLVIISCIVYLFHALYSFILFLVGNRDKRILYFSLMIICIIIATLAGESLLFKWLPFNYEWSIKFFYLSMIAGGYFLMQCIKHLLPIRFRFAFPITYMILCSLSVLVIIVLPATYNWQFSLFYITVLLIPCLVAPFLMYRATTKINGDNIYFLLSIIAAVGSLIWLIIFFTRNIEIISYPIDLMIATICFSTYWFKRYFRVLNESQKQAKELKEVDKQKDEFLTTIAHEMRNPLHSILNISQSVLDKEKIKPGENSVKDLDLMITIGRHMSTLLDSLLDLERMKENRTVIHPEDGSVHSLAEAVIDMIRFMTGGKQIKLINQIPVHFPLVYADKNRLIQILFNLLHNAVKHSHASEVVVDAAIQGKWAKISVSDNGIGIGHKHGAEDFAGRKDGHGLGLNICRQLVEMHGGSLEISSSRAQGSTFSFTLKLSDPSNQKEQTISTQETDAYVQISATEATIEQPNIPVSPVDTIRILAVDDDPMNVKVLESIFASAPYEISTVLSGQDALSMLDTGDWDVIIADVMMPHMSGYELTRIIRERFTISELPILLLTARSQPEDIVTGFLSGANDYVAKPAEGYELRLRINTLANLKKSIDERRRMEAALFQARIEPHFLFNTINSIASLSEVDTTRMTDLLVEFGNYLRKSFDFKNFQRVVPLEHELELLHSYLFIEKQRFDKRLNVVWEVDPKIELNIPPLSIQPLVENAVKHGVLKRKNGGNIRICITDEGDVVGIAIIDDGVGMNEIEVQRILETDYKKGFGIYNTNWRLKQLYGHGIEIESTPDQGTTVRFHIPKKRNQ